MGDGVHFLATWKVNDLKSRKHKFFLYIKINMERGLFNQKGFSGSNIGNSWMKMAAKPMCVDKLLIRSQASKSNNNSEA
jgi:hypothetical protein